MTPEERTATQGFIAAFDKHFAELRDAEAQLTQSFEWLPDATKYTVHGGRTRSALASIGFSVAHLSEAVEGLRTELQKQGEGA